MKIILVGMNHKTAPVEIRELVSVRKDTLSHAYELLKVDDPRKRRRLADQVARGELSLVRLREKVEGRPTRPRIVELEEEPVEEPRPAPHDSADAADEAWTGRRLAGAVSDDSLIAAKQQLADAVEELVGVLRAPTVMDSIGPVDRANLAKYLTIAKLRLENAIALVRSGEPRE